MPQLATAQAAGPGSDKISVQLFEDQRTINADGSVSGTMALLFTPSSAEWHGYWSNPGDAGLGMTTEWDFPADIGDALYPVPRRLEIAGLMNHIYKGPYAVLFPYTLPANEADAGPPRVTVDYLACTDTICVPQRAQVTRSGAVGDPRFKAWRATIAPQLDSEAGFEIVGDRLRVGLPLPETYVLGNVHLFLGTNDLGGGRAPDYAGIQSVGRDGNLLVVEVPLKTRAGGADQTMPDRIEGILALDEVQGVRFTAVPRDVPLEGVKSLRGPVDTPPLWVLLIAALAGGLLLNILPCVFPILSLKALALAKAGGDEVSARRDALAYTAGVVLACAALGALILLLRSAGQQIGWAFQLQEPLVVAALLMLALTITANFLGLFEVPGLVVSGRGASTGGSFATGLLAAFVATPCTGPFMALALGAALVLRPIEGFAIFTALGVGLALPFLLIGFIPAFRRRLPKPGPWMARFRRWMALPMGLTALALAWLVWRVGGWSYLLMAGAAGIMLMNALISFSPGPSAKVTPRKGLRPVWLAALAFSVFMLVRAEPVPVEMAAQSLLDPQPFSQAALAEARTSGKPVFVWFTADWCVTCKVNEGVAIEREETRAAFDKAGVIALRGDWTRADPEISAFLAKQGAAGVPLYLWYAPGSEAETLPQVLTPDLLAGKAQEQTRSRRR